MQDENAAALRIERDEPRFGQLPKELMLDTDVSFYARVLYPYLHWRALGTGNCFPSYRCIESDLGGCKQTIANALKELESRR